MRKTGLHRGCACLGAAVVTAVLASPSCSAPSKGALIMSITTDMQTPKDISVLSVYVETNSVPKLDYIGRVLPDGTVSMPSTLAIVEPDDPNAQVRIRVIAFQEQKARVLRDVLTTVPHQRTALLRMPLNFLDDGSVTGTLPQQYLPGNGVPEGDTQFQPTDPDPTSPEFMKDACDWTQQQTMIDGACKGAVIDSSKLPDYSDSQVFGNGGTSTSPSCFDVTSCFAQYVPVPSVTMGASGCSFPVPPGVNAADVNVALATNGTGTQVGGTYLVPLESDPGEGFSVQGQTVNLVAGVCAKLKTAQLVVASSNACPSKVEAAPVCEPNQTGGSRDSSPPITCSGGYTLTCPNKGTCTGAGCSTTDCSGGTVTLSINGTVATVTSARGGDAGQGFVGSAAGTVDRSTCTVSVDAPIGCDGGGEPWTFDLDTGTASVTLPSGGDGGDSCGIVSTCSFTGCTVMPGGGDGGVSGCGTGLTFCSGSCVDTSNDPSNCGGCGNHCSSGQTCQNASCGPQASDSGVDDGGGGCTPPSVMCGGSCVNVTNNPNDCGGCGVMCTGGFVCEGTSCVPGASDGGVGDSGGPPDGGPTCTPRTCAQLGVNCGPNGDGCGGEIQCGTCQVPEYCGGGGFATCGTGAVSEAGTDGGPACTSVSCTQQGVFCGPADDGCGNLLQCGTCTPPQTCGGAGIPGQCG